MTPTVSTISHTMILPGTGSLSAKVGAVPMIRYADTSADKISVRVYTPDWKAMVGDPIELQSPFNIGLNHLQSGDYVVEIRPYLKGKYIGAERKSFRLVIASDAPAVKPPTPVSPPAKRAAWGLTGGLDDSPATVKQVLGDMGAGWLRVWCGVDDFPIAAIKKFTAVDTIDVIATIQPGEGVKLADLDMRAWAKKNRLRIKESDVAILVAGNEWNFSSYRPRDLSPTAWHKPYVEKFLKPLNDMLGDLVLIASMPIAHNASPAVYLPQYVALAEAGAMDHCDYVDMHPYCTPQNIATMAQVMRAVKDLVKKPMIATEFDLVTTTPAKEWHAHYPTHAANAAAVFDLLCHYRIDARSGAQKHWMLDISGNKTEFYDAVVKAAKGK